MQRHARRTHALQTCVRRKRHDSYHAWFPASGNSSAKRKNGIKRILKNCLSVSSDRASLFDETYNSTSNILTVLLCIVSSIMGGLLLYHYFSYSEPDFFFKANHPAMISIYVGILLVYLIVKWIVYTFVDWIFFDKEKTNCGLKVFSISLQPWDLYCFPQRFT